MGSGEQSWYGCVVPDDLLYDVERDVWVRIDGDEVVLGMTDVAQTMCGKFVSVTWKKPGRIVARGKPLAIVESSKWAGPFPSPLTGEIVATNQTAFEDDVLLCNRDPSGAGWLIRLLPTQPADELPDLVDGATAFGHYRAFIEANDIRCFRCAD